jgi:beta-N-acetylhexosaminidase
MRIKIFIIALTLLIACKSQQPIQSGKTTGNNPAVDSLITKVKKDLPEKVYSLEFKVGQMILVGINTRNSLPETDSLRKDITDGKTGGIILFEKNINPENSKENLKKLISDLQAGAPVPLFMSIDEEGGKVHRLKEKYGFVKMPSAEYLGSLKNTDSTYYYTKNLAALMAELGFNVNFAPDVDVALNPNNPVIAKVGRSYSADPKTVSKHSIAAIKAHREYHVKTALKHFPGHGSSMTDSHYGITDVTKQWSEIELIPYRDIINSGNADAIMTAHIVNCKLDTSCLPATLSKKIVTGLLRKELKFNGVVFSDDMQMHAISKNYGLENALKMSIEAGVDVVVFGNNVNASDRITPSEIHALIMKMVNSGEISMARIDESFKRIMELKGIKVK